MRLSSAAIAVAFLACGGGAPPPSSPPPGAQAAPPAPASGDPLAQVAWMEGRWESGLADAASEHWTRAGDRWVGIGLTTRGGKTVGFEILTVSMKDGRLVYTAMPNGKTQVDFPASAVQAEEVEFTNPSHDFPKSLRYWRKGDQLFAQASAPSAKPLDYTWKLAGPGKTEALEQADLAFAADVASGGADAWAAWFDAEGAQWSDEPVVGRDAVRALMAPVFARPGFRLEWKPTSSGLSPAGDVGYTIGNGVGTAPGRPPFHTVYATIWRRQADGTWKVLYDVGWTQPERASGAAASS